MSEDLIHHPSHYTSGGIETWDFIRAKGLDFMLGNVIKYVVRAGKKASSTALEDLRKARAYLNEVINTMEGES